MDTEDWIRFEELLEELNQELQRAIRMQAAAIESSRCLHVAIRQRLARPGCQLTAADVERDTIDATLGQTR